MNNPLSERIEALFNNQLYHVSPEDCQATLLPLLRDHVLSAAHKNGAYANYLKHWPVAPQEADRIEALPYLPVTVFKQGLALALCPPEDFVRSVSSSSTSGQAPSQIVIDGPTSKRMTKAVAMIVGDSIGNHRRPYLVVDEQASNARAFHLGARAAAIRGLQPFARETLYCLKSSADDTYSIDEEALLGFAAQHKNEPVLVYGFTYMVWLHLIKPLLKRGLCLNLAQVHILHSGGWKKLVEESVSKEEFNRSTASVFGCEPERVVDFYGMAENVGIIYPDCQAGNKHCPAFGAVIIRDPLSLQPVKEGGVGFVQVCSALPTSFPGHLLLTEDLGQVVKYDHCACGRRGIAFRLIGRAPQAEVRGCGNIVAERTRAAARNLE